MTATSIPRSSRPLRAACVAAAALALGVVTLAPVAVGQAAPAAAPERDVDVRPCARPALSPALKVKAPKSSKSTRALAAHTTAVRGRELKVPARAQALAVAAQLAGDLPNGGRAAGRFYRELAEIKSWQTLPPTIAIHRVLGTPDPFRYERFWPQAILQLKKIAVDVDAVESQVSPAGLAPSRCYVTASDVSGLPLPPGTAFTVRTQTTPPAGRRDGGCPPSRRPSRSETKFDAACGTPVVAATRGVVELVSTTPRPARG